MLAGEPRGSVTIRCVLRGEGQAAGQRPRTGDSQNLVAVA